MAGTRADTTEAMPPSFSHVVVIVLENKEADELLEGSEAPTFARLAREHALLARYYTVAHPSLPNYLALVSGSTQGITSNCSDCLVDAPSLADTLEAAGKTWKSYAEGLPRPGFTGAFAGRYAKKHNPFLYFRDVVGRPDRLARVVPLTRFRVDLAADQLPDFALVIPDLCHSMHDCPVAEGDAWLRAFVEPLLKSPAMRESVVFVIFDEGRPSAGRDSLIPALALGPAVRPHSRYLRRTSHYGLLRTIEDAWSLPRLGRSARAAPISGIWR